jgi:hypothetical protein
MDDKLIRQLGELASACRQREVKPIICGGLGVYLSFCKKEGQIRQMIRATQDIDLMFCRQDLLQEAKRKAMAEMITGQLQYVVQEDKKHFGFRKEPNQNLDILVPLIKELPQTNYRLKIVESALHGHITQEAEFVDEDLRTILLSDISREYPNGDQVELYIPCLTNLMIMKLYAFYDRIDGTRKKSDRAMAHALDVYIIIMLTDIEDLKAGQKFLSRHRGSDIIGKTKLIIENSFSRYENAGWQTVLGSSNFYPTQSIAQRNEMLKQASTRLLRWFE